MNFETVLIVHGDKSERETFRDFIATDGRGIQIREVSSEDEAERMIKEQHFDVILSSIILTRFRELFDAGTNIIILIPDESEEQLARLTEHGLQNYQVFPTAEMDLHDKVNAVSRDGVKRNHPRYDVSGTLIEFHHGEDSLNGRVLNISEGGFLCEVVADADDDGRYRDDLVTIRFPRKYGRQVLSKIRCNYLATRRSTKEGSQVRSLIVMLLPRLEPHHYEVLLTTLQRVITRQLPLLRWKGGQFEINVLGHRSRYTLFQVVRNFVILIAVVGALVGSSWFFKVPEALWVSDADRVAALEQKQRELEAALAASRQELQAAVSKKRIVFSEKIQFEWGHWDIKPASYSVLDDIAAVIKNNSQIRLLSIEGHSDADGDATYNLVLSARRADTVREYLVGKGVSAEILQSSGFGESRPIAGNDTLEGKRMNRRVEFVIREQD